MLDELLAGAVAVLVPAVVTALGLLTRRLLDGLAEWSARNRVTRETRFDEAVLDVVEDLIAAEDALPGVKRAVLQAVADGRVSPAELQVIREHLERALTVVARRHRVKLTAAAVQDISEVLLPRALRRFRSRSGAN